MTYSHALPAELDWLNATNLFDVLEAKRKIKWLDKYLPEVGRLFEVPQNPKYHPEVCTFMHIRLCLRAAEALNLPPAARFAVLCHDLGKGITPKEQLPKHINHESTGVPLVRSVAERFGVSSYVQLLAERVCRWHLHAHPGYATKPKSILNFLMLSGLIDKQVPEEFIADFVLSCLADIRGRLNKANASRIHHDALMELAYTLRGMDTLNRIESTPADSRERQAILREVYPIIESSPVSEKNLESA